MALAEFQQNLYRLIAQNRIEQGESYVAGRAALNTILDAPRLSRDIDLFYDTHEAVISSWEADQKLLSSHRYSVEIVRERKVYIEALVGRDGESVLMQWTADSAFRFFPLVQHPILGLTLHPFDLATNKVLALVGRLEVRDWIDLIRCHTDIQKAGYLIWAACGKDPGFNPFLILQEAKRSSHYTSADLAELDFSSSPPRIEDLASQWREILREGEKLIALLPADEAGKCILGKNGELYNGTPEELSDALTEDHLILHSGTIKGAFPAIAS